MTAALLQRKAAETSHVSLIPYEKKVYDTFRFVLNPYPSLTILQTQFSEDS